MKKFLIVIGMIAACAGCARVQDGTLTKCKHCDKVMTNTVQTLTVPIWQARKHHVNNNMTYCAVCGSQEVTTQVHRVCLKCKVEYRVDTETSLRSEDRKDETVRTGFCETCGNAQIPTKEIIVCARCGNGQESAGSARRDSLPDPKGFKGTIEYKENGVVMRSADRTLVIEHHIDSCTTTIAPAHFYCETCQVLVRRETTTKRPR